MSNKKNLNQNKMVPTKEKAQELVSKFGEELALKLVDELLENLINSNLNYLNTIKHYQQLKQEIINL